MLKDKFKVSFRNGYEAFIYFEIPSICPHCGEKMSPRYCYGISRELSNDTSRTHSAGLLLQCVNCEKYFVRIFLLNQLDENYAPIEMKLSYNPPIDANIPKEINDISEKFSDIYIQALKAKQAGLDQIYGIGLRKALEFLAKDFAIHLDPDKKEEITKNQLGYVIKNFFKDYPNIIKLFQAASWIGNDEVHYDRKFPNEDAETISKFISVIMMQVSSQLIYEKAANLVDSSAKPETKS